MKAYCHYAGTGTRVRVWVSGDTEFTETSYFQVSRDMDVDFEKLPVDASLAMEDNVMDLMEPYGYEALENFRPEYMSGFLGRFTTRTQRRWKSEPGIRRAGMLR